MRQPSSDPDLASILGDIYDAALDAARWQGLTDRLAVQFGGSAVLFEQDSRSPSSTLFTAAGIDACFINSYISQYAAINAWTPGVSVCPAGGIVTGDEIITRR